LLHTGNECLIRRLFLRFVKKGVRSFRAVAQIKLESIYFLC
jgi:hypothetical protein